MPVEKQAVIELLGGNSTAQGARRPDEEVNPFGNTWISYPFNHGALK